MNCQSIIKKIFSKYWPRYLIGILLAGLTSYLNAQIPMLLGRVVDFLSLAVPDASSAISSAKTMIIVAGTAFATRFIWRYFVIGVIRIIELKLRQGLFSHLQCLDADFYEKYNTGDIITRNISDIMSVRMMFGIGMTGIIDSAVVTAVSIMYMVDTVDWKLTLAAALPLPFLALLLAWLRKVMRARYKGSQEALSNLNAKAQENISGVRVVKAFAQENSEVELYSRLSKRKWQADMSAVKVSGLIAPSSQLLFGLTFTAFLIIGGKMVIDGSMSLGDYVAFNGYLALIMEPMNTISRVVQIWQRAKVSFGRLNELFDFRPSVTDAAADESATPVGGDIEFRDVTFKYPTGSEPALNNVSFTLPSGGMLAVMGVTGCGKSTIAELLMRQRPIEREKIFIGGKDVNDIPLSALRSASAYVPQNGFIFSDTIAENIAFFDENITDEQVVEAAKAAALHDNVLEQPDGYDTVVGERGTTLSGGQKQRVCIARALVRKPAILVLDDCLSAVDTVTEQAILGALLSSREGRTTLFITHRVSAAMAADSILLLAPDGSVAGRGTHEQLKENCPAYRELLAIIAASEQGKRGER